jgi:hypothetical protein
MPVTLCYDARAIAEVDAARFVHVLQQYLQDPSTMLAAGELHNQEISDARLEAFL